MIRQRLRGRTSRLALAGRLVTVVFALALIWYGLMALLLAFKVSPDTVNAISGYRTIFDELSALEPSDVTGAAVRAIAAAAGLVAFAVFGYLAFKELPRPYLARSDVELEDTDRGLVTIAPRAAERAAEIAACQHPAISSASGRYSSEDLELSVSVTRARDLPDTLRDVQRRAREALTEHGLPAVPVNVNLAGYDRRNKRELN